MLPGRSPASALPLVCRPWLRLFATFSGLRGCHPRTETCMRSVGAFVSCQRAAALSWLNAAVAPQASTAAVHSPSWGYVLAADRVDTAVDGVQAPALEPVVDRLRRVPARKELRVADDAMLSSCKEPDRWLVG